MIFYALAKCSTWNKNGMTHKKTYITVCLLLEGETRDRFFKVPDYLFLLQLATVTLDSNVSFHEIKPYLFILLCCFSSSANCKFAAFQKVKEIRFDGSGYTSIMFVRIYIFTLL